MPFDSSHSRMTAFMRRWLAGLLLLSATPAHAYTVEITQPELQAMIVQGFPIRQQMPFASAILSQPRITIPPSGKRLRLAVAISTTFPNNITSKGRAEIEGELGYDADKGEFHLREPSVTALSFDQLPPQYRELVTSIVSGIAYQTLPIIVIYRLDEKDLRQSMARQTLREVTVSNGKLIVELAW
jgi:hypothetical protein